MNTVQDPTTTLETATVRLHHPDGTLDVSIEDASPLFGYSVRLEQFPEQFDSEGRLRGDAIDLAEPFTLVVLVHEESELAARQALDALWEAARDATYIQHMDSTRYRALQGDGLSVESFLPDKMLGSFTSWRVPITFLPVFARATAVQTTDPSVYVPSLNGIDASVYWVLSDGSGYVTLTDGTGAVEITT